VPSLPVVRSHSQRPDRTAATTTAANKSSKIAPSDRRKRSRTSFTDPAVGPPPCLCLSVAYGLPWERRRADNTKSPERGGVAGSKATTVQGVEDMAAKKSQGAKVRTGELVRANLHLAADAHQRLSVHALMSGRSAGDLVSELISLHLRSWSLPADLTSRVKITDRLDTTVEANDSSREAA
jgi:hypothetical protein